MARQPFSQLYKTEMHYAIGVGALNKRPELASLVGQCIALWTDIELQMALALAAILKADNPSSVALFLAIRTSPTRREALAAVARNMLAGDDLDAFEALLIVYQSLEKQRNALAHGVYGYSDSIEDALLWDSIQNHADFLLNVYVAEYKGTP